MTNNERFIETLREAAFHAEARGIDTVNIKLTVVGARVIASLIEKAEAERG